ncbi:hypothetical protein FB565_001527 [Actinoplanes lutulentus]|uniref:Uncharacterized protein n=1 Tax=Actinoplanes lutulentus TaxID=1287878 RepID=A0A327ZEU4_9ACTN|nr:hypothetical protein [Actinoplanes lutulentus]MBB2941823.1 hypothetical protein [Actinoplanes lutulentus]RAK39742.1 hypothetical protein B0I29_104280 [Actinoplanes lutulentus]
MSLINQQRIRIASTAVGSRDPWAGFCPCCQWGGTFLSWLDAMTWAALHARQDHCRFCIDTQMPAGREDVLGELYERCPVCTIPCADCDGLAVYPANYNTPTELVDDLAVLRLTPIFCDGCHGVAAVIPLDPEVLA